MYSSIADVRNALTPGASADDASTPSGLQDDQITDAINEADAIVDAHLAMRYAINQDDVDPLVAEAPVRWFSRDIAAYLATLTFKRNKDVVVDDPARLRYRMVMDILVAVRDFKANLNLTPVGGEDSAGVDYINLYEGPLFDLYDFGLGVSGVVRTRWSV